MESTNQDCVQENMRQNHDEIKEKNESDDLIETKCEDLRITISFDQDNDFFIMSFLEVEKIMFGVKLKPSAFQDLSNDMIKIVKNYNMYQLEEFKQQFQKEKENKLISEISEDVQE